MNYYNPYFYSFPTTSVPKVGLLSRLFGTNITFSGILNGTQRALNFANQAIPLVKEVKPMIGNARTMFKVMNEFKRVEKPVKKNNNVLNSQKENEKKKEITNNEGPNFFI